MVLVIIWLIFSDFVTIQLCFCVAGSCVLALFLAVNCGVNWPDLVSLVFILADSLAEMDAHRVWALYQQIRATNPLVQCITNYVSMDIMANALLAIGASPAMVCIL